MYYPDIRDEEQKEVINFIDPTELDDEFKLPAPPTSISDKYRASPVQRSGAFMAKGTFIDKQSNKNIGELIPGGGSSNYNE